MSILTPRRHSIAGVIVGLIIVITVPWMMVSFASVISTNNQPQDNQDPAPPPSPPFVSPDPGNLDFGNQVVRSTSAAKRITLMNSGGKSLYIDSVTLGGDNSASFNILKDTCTGATVGPNKACILDVTFTPRQTGERNARLRINDNALDSPQRLRLKGTGINSNDVAPF